MSAKNLESPPAADEIEVSVFGPGIGECILVHCGHGHWLCVDCARDEGRNWPLKYLRGLGLNPADAVRLIVATHWHADHVRGISELVDVCHRALFVASSAIRADEFEQLVARFSVDEVQQRQAPLGEVRRVFELLAGRKNQPDFRPPEFVNEHQTVENFSAGPNQIIITALSPSAQDRMNALTSFAKYFVPIDQAATGLSPLDQNHASVVLLVEIGDERVLLGADLETTKSDHTGWRAIVKSTRRPQLKSTIYKIPHHGSSSSQCEEVWDKLITPDAIAVLSPYASAEVPKAANLAWLQQRGESIFATALPNAVEVPRRREVKNKMQEVTLSIRSYKLPDEPGIVRLRKRINSGSKWSVELFGSALQI